MAEYVCELTDDYPDVSFYSDEYSGTVERRERIVRCRDCKHAIMSYQDRYPRCAGPMVKEATLVDPDGFCAWGEERDA